MHQEHKKELENMHQEHEKLRQEHIMGLAALEEKLSKMSDEQKKLKESSFKAVAIKEQLNIPFPEGKTKHKFLIPLPSGGGVYDDTVVMMADTINRQLQAAGKLSKHRIDVKCGNLSWGRRSRDDTDAKAIAKALEFLTKEPDLGGKCSVSYKKGWDWQGMAMSVITAAPAAVGIAAVALQAVAWPVGVVSGLITLCFWAYQWYRGSWSTHDVQIKTEPHKAVDKVKNHQVVPVNHLGQQIPRSL